LLMEFDAPPPWHSALEARGHTVRVVGALNPVDVGCAQIIAVDSSGDHVTLTGASDPRSPEGDAVGL
jgi:hypothetical protein